jgi:cytochrome c oxidase cbb3-type subunit 1
MRLVGGAIFMLGALLMVVNVLMTVMKASSEGSLRQAKTAVAGA